MVAVNMRVLVLGLACLPAYGRRVQEQTKANPRQSVAATLLQSDPEVAYQYLQHLRLDPVVASRHLAASTNALSSLEKGRKAEPLLQEMDDEYDDEYEEYDEDTTAGKFKFGGTKKAPKKSGDEGKDLFEEDYDDYGDEEYEPPPFAGLDDFLGGDWDDDDFGGIFGMAEQDEPEGSEEKWLTDGPDAEGAYTMLEAGPPDADEWDPEYDDSEEADQEGWGSWKNFEENPEWLQEGRPVKLSSFEDVLLSAVEGDKGTNADMEYNTHWTNVQNVNAVGNKYRLHDGDTGSAPVQIARLTARIAYLTKHMMNNPMDKHSLRGLVGLVEKRKDLLWYLLKKDMRTFIIITSELGIRGSSAFKTKEGKLISQSGDYADARNALLADGTIKLGKSRAERRKEAKEEAIKQGELDLIRREEDAKFFQQLNLE